MAPQAVSCPANERLVRGLLAKAAGQFRGSHMAKLLKRAGKSVCKYPLPVATGQQAMALEHVGAWVAEQIDDVLSAPVADAAPEVSMRPETARPSKSTKKRRRPPASVAQQSGGATSAVDTGQTAAPKTRRQPKPYIPKHRSGNWAIIMALAHNTARRRRYQLTLHAVAATSKKQPCQA